MITLNLLKLITIRSINFLLQNIVLYFISIFIFILCVFIRIYTNKLIKKKIYFIIIEFFYYYFILIFFREQFFIIFIHELKNLFIIIIQLLKNLFLPKKKIECINMFYYLFY